jgi:hypothetical protein
MQMHTKVIPLGVISQKSPTWRLLKYSSLDAENQKFVLASGIFAHTPQQFTARALC